MNNLSIANNEVLTMSSRDIAIYTSKKHNHVIRDIKKLYSELYNDDPSLDDLKNIGKRLVDGVFVDVDIRGYVQYFTLDRRHTDCLLTGYSAKARMKVIERWHDLEEKNKPEQPKIPTNFAEALQLAADQAKQLELAAPKVAFVDNFVERESLQNATQVAQSLKLSSARKLNSILDEIGGIYSGAVKRSRVFTVKFINNGYGDIKQTEQGYPQSLFTTKGIVYLNELLTSEGYI
tara:strand:+ start:13812 stop:14513 length:702 start_codon:yes stop_codon:yes gene_type:complete